LFATHYHELTALSATLDGLANVTMRVKEWQCDVVFLHEVGPGAADRSYGIQVAKLAGLPPSVIERAELVLSGLEEGETLGRNGGKDGAARLADRPAPVRRRPSRLGLARQRTFRRRQGPG